ncbi:MAG: YhfC family intramembrane metalloprotease [Coriobacteriia bacterium]|nr:YhfC family intramembrane metalloprotease [Coriobacteriia bacterium]
MIPTVNIITLAALCIVSVALPVIGCIIVWRRTGASVISFFIGMAVFLVCFIIAIATSVLGQFLIASPVILTLVLSLRAGLVEEFGRFVAFKWLLKRRTAVSDGFMYGVGHGGMEVLLVLSLSMVSNLVLVFMFNSGGMEALAPYAAPDQIELLAQSMDELAKASPLYLSVGLIERISAMCIHISLSVIVFCAVRQRKWLYFLLAIGLHTLADASTALYVGGYVGVWGIEAILAGVAVCFALIAWRIARGYRLPVEPVEVAAPSI